MMRERGSSSSSSGLAYEVFLSFRGTDTRDGFCDSLYTSLVDAGVFPFRDDEELPVGEDIGGELLRALDHSKIFIPIFSADYASSKWCLMELAHMFKCLGTGTGQRIFPIFYFVTPAEVKHQTGCYKEAFVSHEKEHDEKTVRDWRAALKDATALKGWDIVITANKKQGRLIKLVVKKVLTVLKKDYLMVTDRLVGIDRHVEAIMDVIRASARQTYIGICGMGGVGKTTVAKALYNQLSDSFDECCFLENVREKSSIQGIESLQGQLITSLMQRKAQKIKSVDEGIGIIKSRFWGKKVLILVDDADQKSQLRALVEQRSWFGEGSLIIITTRNKDILGTLDMDLTYEMGCMNFWQSLELFCKHAFRSDQPSSKFFALSKDVVRITGGLPLALEVIGSSLYGQNEQRWEITLRKLRNVSPREVQNKLKISYDSLEKEQQQIFLDIACFFIGYDKDIPSYMWEDCNFHPVDAIEALQVMSLIKINEDNSLWMHDQLRDMGKKIVLDESQIIEHRSRLWNSIGLIDIIFRGPGSDRVEAICLKYNNDLTQLLSSHERLAKLPSLRFLRLDSPYNDPDKQHTEGPRYKLSLPPVDHLQKLTAILPKLRWFSCHDVCPVLFMFTKFSFENMVILDLSESEVTETWLGWSQVETAKRLKVLNLTNCKRMKVTPNFSYGYDHLERLILSGCKSLVEIHSSIGKLKKLILLNLEHCTELSQLPEEIANLVNLRQLLVAKTGIQKFPDWQAIQASETVQGRRLRRYPRRRLASLTKLDLSGSKIVELCSFIGSLKSLESLCLAQCKSLARLPNEIGELSSLSILDLSGSSGITELPNSVGDFRNLKILKTCSSGIKKLPVTIGKLTSLEELDASSTPLEGKLPLGIKRLMALKKLICTKTAITFIPQLPSNLTILIVSSTYLQHVPDLSGLSALKVLDLKINASEPKLMDAPGPSWIRTLQQLETLTLSLPHIVTLSPDISALTLLKKFVLSNCKNLQDIPKLPSSIVSLKIEKCPSLRSTFDLTNLKWMAALCVRECPVTEFIGFEGLESLEVLGIMHCENLRMIPDLSSLNNLRELVIGDCANLIEIPGKATSLKTLLVGGCPSLERLLDLRDSQGPKNLIIVKCPRVRDIEQFAELKNTVDIHVPSDEATVFDTYVVDHIENAYSVKTGQAKHEMFCRKPDW